jgi:predicted RNA-binding protein|tara:strand:+ start:216 stop:452 length:237 start_codon:yes stop_codon:yes gene_type:complete
MAKKYIHVNQHKIRSNLKHNLNEPVITVKTSNKNIYGHQVDILGESKVIYGNNKPILSCGARVVIETHSEVLVDGKKI